MDLVAILGAIATMLGLIGAAAKLMFDRQEARIKAVEEALKVLTSEHMACREENAGLRARVQYLEQRLGIDPEDCDDHEAA